MNVRYDIEVDVIEKNRSTLLLLLRSSNWSTSTCAKKQLELPGLAGVGQPVRYVTTAVLGSKPTRQQHTPWIS